MLNDDRMPTLISAESGLLRDSILTILESFPFINVVGAAEGKFNTLDAVKQCNPRLVLVDCSTCNAWLEIIQAIRGRQTEIKWVAITDTIQTSRQALKNGADSALIKGFTSQELQMALQRLIFNKPVGDSLPR
ncbi:MAG: hypothetical protein P4L50_27150 [Anaerolineaceae bacterium]|nr:hypothetical protein [Anaerolineaceae bacterium]